MFTKQERDKAWRLAEKALSRELVWRKDITVSDAIKTAPADTGFMRQSIDGRVDRLAMKVWAKTDYAEYVEKGTKTMIKAHGKHDPDNPVKTWAALRKRGGRDQQMPFLLPALKKAMNTRITRR